jgi:hypothetical protein
LCVSAAADVIIRRKPFAQHEVARKHLHIGDFARACLREVQKMPIE